MITYDIQKLERARAIKGWSKGKVARAVGLTPQAITSIWQGKSKSAETLKQIAEVLGLSVEDILIEEPQSTAQDQPAA